MEKIVIYGIVLLAVIFLTKKGISFFKGDGHYGRACSSGGSCSGVCHCEKERRSQ